MLTFPVTVFWREGARNDRCEYRDDFCIKINLVDAAISKIDFKYSPRSIGHYNRQTVCQDRGLGQTSPMETLAVL
jgi:hypothetical protein